MAHHAGDTEARRDTMQALRTAGLTYKDIGFKLGISRERVRQIVNVQGRITPQKKLDKKEAALLRTADVARLLGIHTNTVRRWADDGSLRSYRVGKRGLYRGPIRDLFRRRRH